MDRSDKMLHQFLNIGEAMLASGGEVNRVEDTMSRMGMAYGASCMNVFVITSSMSVTMTMPDGNEWTQIRRIRSSGSTDLLKLERLNHLSRRFCSEPFSSDRLEEEFKKINEKTPDRWPVLLGSMLAAGSFSLFFGGSAVDGIAGALSAILIFILQERLAPFCNNKITFHLLCSIITGSAICLIARLFPCIHIGQVMIGDIMLLIPGVAMTNSIRDILVGDTIFGIMRFIETVFWSGALAVGFIAAILLIGG